MANNLFLKEDYTIKDLPETERPREKLIKHGADKLSNAELIAVIIRTGGKNATAIDLGERIVSLDKSGLRFLRNISVEELMKVDGIGECKASQLIAALEIGRRISYDTGLERIRINSPSSVARAFMDEMRFLQKEHFRVILLNTKNQIISTEEISIGTLNASIVHPRDVFKVAIKRNSNSIILLHNHPSGDPSPSREDIDVTNRLVEAGKILGIRVLDHLIIGDNRYTSLKREGLI